MTALAVANPKQDDGSLPSRIPRCRLLDHNLNRCQNPCLSEDGIALCARHLAAAHTDYLTLAGRALADLGGRP
jgi:hypothetical protein